MLTRRSTLALITAPVALALPTWAQAREPEVFAVDGIAIRGTDPTAYAAANAPVAGSPDHRLSWNGADWHFASAEGKAAFEADPETAAPAFGGYCAYAASLGYLAPTDPQAWTIHEGKLYLNASLRARELWLKDIPGNIAKGMANWPGILG